MSLKYLFLSVYLTQPAREIMFGLKSCHAICTQFYFSIITVFIDGYLFYLSQQKNKNTANRRGPTTEAVKFDKNIQTIISRKDNNSPNTNFLNKENSDVKMLYPLYEDSFLLLKAFCTLHYISNPIRSMQSTLCVTDLG